MAKNEIKTLFRKFLWYKASFYGVSLFEEKTRYSASKPCRKKIERTNIIVRKYRREQISGEQMSGEQMSGEQMSGEQMSCEHLSHWAIVGEQISQWANVAWAIVLWSIGVWAIIFWANVVWNFDRDVSKYEGEQMSEWAIVGLRISRTCLSVLLAIARYERYGAFIETFPFLQTFTIFNACLMTLNHRNF